MSREATKPAASDGRRSGWRSPRRVCSPVADTVAARLVAGPW